MKDLYRIVPYDFETEDESVFVGRREMLVKVVPDYEAATKEINDWAYEPEGSSTVSEAAQRVLAAALEGSNDE